MDRNRIDLKSLLIGALLTVIVFMTLGAGMAPGNVGRYQATAGSGQLMVINTETGVFAGWSYTQNKWKNRGQANF